ncbi:MAG: UDP-N-acetylmuramoyl-L-alanyl-D-glutamate--2,6-diaminopimelate ligase [Elusimicrobiaceae bacterium]|nr:UDP-N-acetylmuramoyl-L-alanyl-D-glutamate--2,6-diaminopimelate ligase [Elusimicrobiaceae bacterium]
MISRVLAYAAEKNITLTGLTFNSADVKPGFAFWALKGVHHDGNAFIEDAIKKGAALIVSAQPLSQKISVPFYLSDQIDADMADAAYEFYGRPSDQLNVIGITGTKGKTSISYLTEAVLEHAGKKVSVLGTVNYRINGHVVMDAPNTTPLAFPLFALLWQMKQQKTDALVMEVSSHSLEQQRVKHIHFDTAVFTNLQRDHLDFHHTFENYFSAKKKLFEELLSADNHKPAKTAIVNIDDAYGRQLVDMLRGRVRVLTYGMENPADYQATEIVESLHGTTFKVKGLTGKINLLGRHNVYNALAALCIGVANGVPEQTALAGLANLPGVPGRMERIDAGQDFFVFVDFAYTDESLQRAFETVKHFKKGRILTVFGCGGDRDRTKRPLMGHTACVNSDYVFLTNDNPRTEDPKQIFADIEKGMEGFSNYVIEPDRRAAIFQAIAAAKKDDIVIIAGKGHEQTQKIGHTVLPFSDQQTVREALEKRHVQTGKI